MAALDYTLTRDELVTTVDEVVRTQFGWDMIYWLCEDKGTGYYEMAPTEPLCANCATERFDAEVNEDNAFLPESVEGYEICSLHCGHCGTDVTEL